MLPPMADVVNFKKEIARLEDQKWEILSRRGPRAAAELWRPIDDKLKRLYAWWARDAYANGREKELPFHLRRLQ